jgi:hypothetical protein
MFHGVMRYTVGSWRHAENAIIVSDRGINHLESAFQTLFGSASDVHAIKMPPVGPCQNPPSRLVAPALSAFGLFPPLPYRLRYCFLGTCRLDPRCLSILIRLDHLPLELIPFPEAPLPFRPFLRLNLPSCL